MEEDGPWEDPHHIRKKDKSNHHEKKAVENITKFFVTNLPEGCTPWEISEFVKVFGVVTGVYIARKLDKFGNRFGFIKFKDVRDVKELERVLNGTKMGNSKLKVNVARFAYENVGFQGIHEVKGHKLVNHQAGNPSRNQFVNQAYVCNGGGKLFRDLFFEWTRI
ncbi:putative RNA recognition motif domain, nucleotide-binding alpha-beta plait domain superfamily [Helianthus annuus]|nr:putative RNA recognition motif domain, nucleotide-binding alpha-beta plait domain superfamily [Helianthus annuus]